MPKLLTDLVFADATTQTTAASGSAAPPMAVMVSPWSLESLGADLAALAQAAPASAAWPVANLGIWVPFIVPAISTIVKMFVYNGATVSTPTVDVGIYDEAFTKVITMGPAAASGGSANSIWERDITDQTNLAAGRYYMAISGSTTAVTVFRTAVSAALLKAMGVFQVASVGTLPAGTVTPAAMAQAYLPYFGVSLRTLVQ